MKYKIIIKKKIRFIFKDNVIENKNKINAKKIPLLIESWFDANARYFFLG